MATDLMAHEELPDSLSGNPIVPNVGLTDGHFRVYNNRIYNYATHDYSATSGKFMMKEWWVWSTDDLVSWTFESELDPSIFGFPPDYKNCWATDSQYRNGKYYWYVCNPDNTYVVCSESPVGPWKSPLGEKKLMEGRDPSVFVDDDGKAYLITGVWNYHMAELNEDMISLKETPRSIKIINPRGPYNQDGRNEKNPTDDKPYLHKHNGKYYLSWGCYYAMSDHVYGPYTYKGCLVVSDRTDPEFRQEAHGLTQDRHASFFEWNNQTYFTCNDLSSYGANMFWRNTIIGYVHYRDNGEIDPVYLKRIGVGQYDASERIEAENFYASSEGIKKENNEGGFEMQMVAGKGELCFQYVRNLKANSTVSIHIATPKDLKQGSVEIWSYEKGKDAELIGKSELTASDNKYADVRFSLKNKEGKQNLRFFFKGESRNRIRVDYIHFN